MELKFDKKLFLSHFRVGTRADANNKVCLLQPLTPGLLVLLF